MRLFRKMLLHTQNTPLYLPMLSVVAAVEIVLAFSAFGYIVVPPISITFMTVPVLVGALFFGPLEGLLLGGVFGLTSMWKASVTATLYTDLIFSPTASGAPLSSLFLSLGTRMMFGLLAGLLFTYVKTIKYKKTGVFISTFIADFVHVMLVYAAIQFCFPDLGITLTYGLFKELSPSSLAGSLFICSIMVLIYSIFTSKYICHFKEEIIHTIPIKKYRHTAILTGFILLMILMAVSLWYHFYDRTEMLLRREGFVMSGDVLTRFWQLGEQFFSAAVALFFIVAVVLMLAERYLIEITQQAKRDLMTGLYNKMTLTRYVDNELNNHGSGFFLILDIDDFKLLNDTCGHPAGDKVLIEVARILQATLPPAGILGRLGGDEFCAYIKGISESEMCAIASEICKNVGMLSFSEITEVSCSIGFCSCRKKRNFSEVYTAADIALYQSKKQGKKRYSFCDSSMTN